MDLTPPLPLPLLAGALLLALAPSAHASPLGPAWDLASDGGDQAVVCLRDRCIERDLESCDPLVAGTVCELQESLRAWCDGDCTVGDPTMDRDHDLLSDEAEGFVCGRSDVRALRSHVENPVTHCASPTDMAGLADRDRDGTPDLGEPAICGLEDQNSDLDGGCDAGGRDHTL